MASTTALFTGLSGLNAHARKIDVIGNNVANVNTTAFKSTRLVFNDLLSRSISGGTPPSDFSGGRNPSQIGFGVTVAGTQRDFTPGPIAATGKPEDMSIDGSGFFVVERNGERFYTRDGSFQLDESFNLTTAGGARLLGHPVNDQYEIQRGQLTTLSAPIGTLTIAEATRNARMAGNLNASGAVAAGGSVLRLGGSEAGGFLPIAGAEALSPASLLTDLADPAEGAAGQFFNPGQSIEVSGVRRGEATLPARSFLITAQSTLQDLADFLAAAMSIQADAQPAGVAPPGVVFDPDTGSFSVTGNTGAMNDLRFDASRIRLADPATGSSREVFAVERLGDATGESVRTTMVVYDSLGTPVEVDVGFVLEQRGDGGTAWRYFIDSKNADGAKVPAGTGVINFDNRGRLVGDQRIEVQIDRAGTGAENPMRFELGFRGEEDQLSALTDQNSGIATTFRDGAPIGTLENFAVGRDGVLYGAFSNTLIRPLGQVVLGTFTNPAGLNSLGDNLFSPAANSGPPMVTQPGELGSGQIIGGALEQSNVDIGREFIDLVLAQTGYTASSRVIRTTDELMQQLLSIVG